MALDLINAPVPATTVLLTRDNQKGLEVFMVTRHHKIDSAYGALVFPGGKLDIQDSDPELLELCAEQNPNIDDLAVFICGIRETFEEAGVLLVRDATNGKMITGQRCAKLDIAYRELLHKGSMTLLDIVKKENIELACDKLMPFARWITPKSFSRQFDASFYLVEVPLDYAASHDNVESVNSFWTTPTNALKEADEERATIIFATRMNLLKLTKYNTVSSLVKTIKKEDVITVEPHLHEKNGSVTYTIPIEAGYGLTHFTENDGPSLKIRSHT
jgi:8-oxo-dGTP pyrophosphatase MutT (NUDIX family)